MKTGNLSHTNSCFGAGSVKVKNIFLFVLFLVFSLSLFSSPAFAELSSSEMGLNRTLAYGDTGEEVTLLQKILNAIGKTIAPSGPGSPGNETTYFGSLTASAVKAFQCEKGIVCDGDSFGTGFGIVGQKTRLFLNNLWKSLSSISPRSQMAQVSGAGSGLVAYYTFDEGSGATSSDSSGNSNTGTLTNGPTWNTADKKVGSGALSFDGVDDKVTVPLTATLNPSSITVAFWANVPSYIGSTNNAIVELGSSVNNFRVRDTSGKWQLLTNGAVNTLSGTANSLAYDQWIHWVFIANSSGLSIYKNGVLNASNAIAYTAGANAIWNLGSSGFYNRQTLDDIRIYNRALSASEVTELYNYTGGGTPPPSPTNQAPTVSAGNAQTITLPGTATLSGTASDDGLPTGSSLITTWSTVSGAGTVTFAPSASSGQATASFSTAGTYVLRLTASDTALTSTSDITIIVNPAQTSDTQAPTVPTNLTATAVSSSQINLSWTASTDNVAVTGYKIYRAGTQIG